MKRFVAVIACVLVSATFAGGQVLWDQPLSAINPNAYVDQEFGDYPTMSSYLADDFTNAGAWTITAIFVPGDGWNGFTSITNASALHWAIYADAGGVPAGDPSGGGSAPQWSLSLPPSDAQLTITNGTNGYPSNVLVTLSTPISLPAGTWWLVFYPTMDFSTGGQYGRQGSDAVNGAVVQLINPGGGFGVGTTWQPWSAIGATLHDLAFRLDGTVAALEADLSLTKTASTPLAQPGQVITYTLDVTNNGPGAETGVTVTDVLPAGVEYDSDGCGGAYDPGTRTWTWTIGALANGASATCNLAVNVASVAGTIVNTASVSGDLTDPTPANDSSSATFSAQGAAIPTLDAIGMSVLLILLAAAGWIAVRRLH